MTRVCCPGCRLRFTPSAETELTACPQCGQPPEPVLSVAWTMGFQLMAVQPPSAPPAARPGS